MTPSLSRSKADFDRHLGIKLLASDKVSGKPISKKKELYFWVDKFERGGFEKSIFELTPMLSNRNLGAFVVPQGALGGEAVLSCIENFIPNLKIII